MAEGMSRYKRVALLVSSGMEVAMSNSMTRKHFVELADDLRPYWCANTEDEKRLLQDLESVLCRFMRAQNPNFDKDRWLDYLHASEADRTRKRRW